MVLYVKYSQELTKNAISKISSSDYSHILLKPIYIQMISLCQLLGSLSSNLSLDKQIWGFNLDQQE